MTTSIKTCFKCGETKSTNDFYKHPAMGDGFLGKCKECTKKDASNRRNEKINEVRAYDLARSKNPARRARVTANTKKRRASDKRFGYSHSAVSNAIKTGKMMKQPCSICGSEKAVAHHESYDRPLDVVWYCQIHHKARHKEMALLNITP